MTSGSSPVASKASKSEFNFYNTDFVKLDASERWPDEGSDVTTIQLKGLSRRDSARFSLVELDHGDSKQVPGDSINVSPIRCAAVPAPQ